MHRETTCDIRLHRPEATADALAQRLQRLVARCALGGVHADQLRGRVIDRDEYGDLAVVEGHGRRQIRTPQRVGRGGDDRAIVCSRPAHATMRLGASTPASRISRSARALLVRTPRWRSFAHTLR